MNFDPNNDSRFFASFDASYDSGDSAVFPIESFHVPAGEAAEAFSYGAGPGYGAGFGGPPHGQHPGHMPWGPKCPSKCPPHKPPHHPYPPHHDDCECHSMPFLSLKTLGSGRLHRKCEDVIIHLPRSLPGKPPLRIASVYARGVSDSKVERDACEQGHEMVLKVTIPLVIGIVDSRNQQYSVEGCLYERLPIALCSPHVRLRGASVYLKACVQACRPSKVPDCGPIHAILDVDLEGYIAQMAPHCSMGAPCGRPQLPWYPQPPMMPFC